MYIGEVAGISTAYVVASMSHTHTYVRTDCTMHMQYCFTPCPFIAEFHYCTSVAPILVLLLTSVLMLHCNRSKFEIWR